MSARRLVLVSCVKLKRSEPAAARDLYTSQLFRGMRGYAEAQRCPWFILSAQYGVLSPHRVIAPYELTLNTFSAVARAAWARGVVEQLDRVYFAGRRVRDLEVTLLAGARYRHEIITTFLTGRGCRVVVPMLHLGLGQQLSYLREYATR